jgi:lipase
VKDGAAIPQILFQREFGHGDRKVLALHCTLAHSGAWRGLAAEMDGEVALSALDMLSHGRSPDWDLQGDFHDRMTQAIAPLLNTPMDLIGHSFGATLAFRLAQMFPEKVRSLCLFEPVLISAARLDDPCAVDVLNEEEGPVFEALERGDNALAARLFNRKWSEGGPKWPDMPEARRAALTRGVHILPSSHATVYDDQPGLLKPEALARLTMPMTVVSGQHTHPVIKVVCHAIASRVQDAIEQEVTAAGHMVPITHPKESAEVLRSLFARAPI